MFLKRGFTAIVAMLCLLCCLFGCAPTSAVGPGAYGLSQERVNELFADLLDGLFTGKTKEVIDRQGIGRGFSMHFPDILYHDGRYMAYYICYATNTGKGGVGLAVSDDGVYWIDKGAVIQPDTDYDRNGAYFAGVWLDEDGTFYLAYECKGAADSLFGTRENIAYATSTDGVHWDKKGFLLMKNTALAWQNVNVGTPDLYKEGDTWYLTFHGYNGDDCTIGVAYGEDLRDLTVVEQPIIPTVSGTARSGTTGRRDILRCGEYYYMVFEVSTDASGGFAGSQWTHMFARSKDMLHWETTAAPQLTRDQPGFGYDGPCWMIVDEELYVYVREGYCSTAVKLVRS